MARATDLDTDPAPIRDGDIDAAGVDALLQSRNTGLAAAGLRLRLERRGRWLGVRGPLPCRKGSGGVRVQRLSLGLPASAAGLLEAEARLLQLQRDLIDGRFAWPPQVAGAAARPRATGPAAAEGGPDPVVDSPVEAPVPGTAPAASRRPSPAFSRGTAAAAGSSFGPTLSPSSPVTGALSPLPEVAPALLAALAAFEQAFFADPRRRRQSAGSRSTWCAAYQPYLRRLRRLAVGRGGLCQDLLLEVLESYGLASRSRQQCGIALAALAAHGGIPLPEQWRERSNGYGLHVARFRQLPLDGAILKLVERIPNPGWRLAYGLMATYGLRNHEVFFCDLSALAPGGDRVLRVLPTTKTGEHQVWPFQPEWVERFELERLGLEPEALPRVCTDLRHTTLQQVGRRVAEQFRRYELPLTPYDLRHAWAVRTIHIGLPDTVAARMMGHSVAIHTRTYHHWITRRDQQQAVDAALSRMRAA
jgi:integrase